MTERMRKPQKTSPELVSRSGVLGRKPLRPILRWVGGKRFLSQRLLDFLPLDIDERTYHEPFLGAATLFFALRPTTARLSDLNHNLVSMYSCVRDEPDLVARYLRDHAARNSKSHYYAVRDTYNRTARFTAAQAARFIYLNRTCFNGIYRVNLAGAFNVPYGYKRRPIIPDAEHMRAIANCLRNATLHHNGFERALQDVSRGDFVYLDPPYPPLNGTSFFSHYTTNRFSRQDHARVAGIAAELERAGCLVLISNADLDWVRSLYNGFHFVDIQATRYVTSSSVKHRVSELIIMNYDYPAKESGTHGYEKKSLY